MLSLVGALATIALLDGLFLIYIQAVEIKSWCLFCLGIDVINALLLALAVRLRAEIKISAWSST